MESGGFQSPDAFGNFRGLKAFRTAGTDHAEFSHKNRNPKTFGWINPQASRFQMSGFRIVTQTAAGTAFNPERICSEIKGAGKENVSEEVSYCNLVEPCGSRISGGAQENREFLLS